ncbi:substrate-binding and VWA domain-containing protein [Actinokineospora sp. HUAS TT18]|uniref:substrate-binding and VWA domain-containing protein n=1 Tax=Actinokineospora sp. HUAS TT18 TaxID=3447451 RepID=UPI003F525BF5
MGRHSTAKAGPGLRSPVVLLAVLLVLALLGWFGYGFVKDRLGGSDCDQTTVLQVTAAPEVTGIVDAAAKRTAEADAAECLRVAVTSRDSAATAESLALSDGSELPDVWVPESTLWLQRAQDKGAWNTPVQGTSIASSPVVLALTEDTATALGWPGKQPTWADVLGPDAANVPIGLPDPARDPVGVSLLYGVRGLTATAPDQAAAMTGLLRRLSANTLPAAADLFTRLPGGTSSEPLGAFPTSENTLLRHNVKGSEAPLVASYADPAVPSLDYPYTVLPKATDAKRTFAQRFLTRLLDPSSVNSFADAGFRAPDGKALRDRSQDKRTSAAPVDQVALPVATEVDQLLNQWAGVNLSSRMQVLLDVSGSMNQPVPGTGLNRMAVTLKAAELGIGLFRPTSKFGMWLFSTNLDGDKDYTELLPVATVTDQLAGGALDKLRGVKAIEGGATGLYDSVLAAYQSARANWEPGRINVVVVLTDGKNEDPNGINREQLLAELAKLQDPRRPLVIVGIGIGPDIDVAELDAISKATGGQAFTTPDPTKIGEIFYAALSKLLCQPPTCKPGS